MATTLNDVAKRAGVSAMTASRVINGRHGVGAETQRRVEEAIAELDYVPNRIARGLSSQKTQTIGLIVPDVVNPFFGPVVRGAETAARRAGLPRPSLQQRRRPQAGARIYRGPDFAPGRGPAGGSCE